MRMPPVTIIRVGLRVPVTPVFMAAVPAVRSEAVRVIRAGPGMGACVTPVTLGPFPGTTLTTLGAVLVPISMSAVMGSTTVTPTQPAPILWAATPVSVTSFIRAAVRAVVLAHAQPTPVVRQDVNVTVAMKW